MNACSLRISQFQLRPAPSPPGDTQKFTLFVLWMVNPRGGEGGPMRPVAKRDNLCTLNFLLQVIPVGKFEKPLNLG